MQQGLARPAALAIDATRFWRTIERSAEIGVGRPGGLARVALSDADRQMRDEFCAWCRDAGLAVTVDAVGNLFARRAGREPGLPPVVLGSHLDTQINGGRYDGIVGVLAALEVVRTLNDRAIGTRRPLEIAVWTNEEGARFSPPMVGSAAFAGVHTVDWVHARRADDGATIGDELRRIGYLGEAPVGGRPLDSYFELHIEQGPELHARGVPVGVVTHGYTAHGFIVDVHGETAHTGPWPMDRRRNALVGAAMLAVAVNDIGWKHHATGGKGTAARIHAWPNKPGILSDYAQFTGDVRHDDPAVADAMRAEFMAALADCARRSQCEMAVFDEWHWGADIFDAAMVSLVRDTARALGVPTLDIASQAGHDAYHIAKVAPTAMIFTPCRDGITHNNREHAGLEETVPGINVLLHAALARADR
ncbi:MAG: Zn-dependent hydrolase [Burkholderiales bacterium]|nr:Zn-dependent hydrolase [Burkholderiales bacterium]